MRAGILAAELGVVDRGRELVGADQRTVGEQIGIAADRRGEMRVTAERQPEMADVRGRIDRLHLRAQHLRHDLGTFGPLFDERQDAVEGLRLHDLAQRERQVERLEIFLERDHLLAARRIVDAVHHRRLLLLERARGRDVGGDHIILDQPVRVEPLARRDRGDTPHLVEHHALLGQVERERFALVARLGERRPTGPEVAKRGKDVGCYATGAYFRDRLLLSVRTERSRSACCRRGSCVPSFDFA